MICASLVPRSEVETIGSTTPMSTRSMSPKLMKKDVIVMSMSSARRSAITSFSCVGTPYGAHDAVALRARDVLVGEGHLDTVEAHAPQRLEMQAVDVGSDEDAPAAERLGALAEHRARGSRGGDGDAGFEAERRAAAGRAHREVRDVLADGRADE